MSENDTFALRRYIRVIWKHRWIVLAITAAVFLATLLATLKQKPVFSATGSLQIDMPKGSVTSIGDLFNDQAAPDSYMQTQAEILRGSALISRMVTKTEPSGAWPSLSAQSIQERVAGLQSRLTAEVVRGSHLIQVSNESESPEQAARTVNQLMALYIDQIGSQRSQSAQNASSWLLDQLNQTKQKLEQATLSLQLYENDHKLLFVQSEDGTLRSIESQRLQDLQEGLNRTERLRIEKDSLRAHNRSGNSAMLRSARLDELHTTESELKQKLSQLETRFGPSFPDVVASRNQLKDVQKEQDAERALLMQSIDADYESASRQESLERNALASQQKLVAGESQQLLQDSILKRDVDLYKQLYEGLLRQMNEAGVSSQLDAPSARILEPAQIPFTRIRPSISKNLMLGLFLGLSFAVGFVFLQEHLQDTFQSGDEITSQLNLPILAVIPSVSIREPQGSEWRYSGRNATLLLEGNVMEGPPPDQDSWFRLDRQGRGNFEMAEAIRNLRTSVLFSNDGAHPRSILISSAMPSEGKTTITANLSVALAQLGKRVLTMDGDLRRPSLHRILSMSNDSGLAEYLQGRCAWQRAIRPSVVPGLNVLASGHRPPNPAELLSSDRMESLIRAAQEQYDVVIVDSPTLLNMADSRVLASYVDAVVLVVKSGSTPKKLVKQAFLNLHSVSARVIGVVLNHVDLRGEYYSYSSSDKHYGSDYDQRMDDDSMPEHCEVDG